MLIVIADDIVQCFFRGDLHRVNKVIFQTLQFLFTDCVCRFFVEPFVDSLLFMAVLPLMYRAPTTLGMPGLEADCGDIFFISTFTAAAPYDGGSITLSSRV